jgi:gliding motility-associated-like protein
MKKVQIIIILAVVAFYQGNTQTNLIPNPSFENITDCPNSNFSGEAMILLAEPWFNALLTPDLFNACDNSIYSSVPINKSNCFKYPHSGNGYAGLLTYFTVPWTTEYMEVKLSQKLLPNKKYYISFYIAKSNCSQPIVCASDALGLAFSDTLFKKYHILSVEQVPNYKTAIQNPKGNILKDTVNWTEISGCYTAKGTEQYAIIGSFRSKANAKDDGCGGVTGAYYYIDDVSVYEIDQIPDTIIICNGQTKKIGAPFLNATYSWNTGEKDSNISIKKAGQYIRNMSIGNCIISDTTVAIDVTQFLKTLTTDTFLCKGDLLKITLPPKGEYNWSNGSKSNHITISNEGIYTVNIKNECGTFNHTFEVQSEICDCDVYFPSAFSPNGDGINDYLECFIGCNFPFQSLRFQVYDRWGELIYTTTSSDYKSIKWDGSFRGQSLNSGVYTWAYEYQYTQKGKIYEKMIFGNVTIN